MTNHEPTNRRSCDTVSRRSCDQTLQAIFEMMSDHRDDLRAIKTEQERLSLRLEPMEQAWRDVQGAKRSLVWAAGGLSAAGAVMWGMFKAVTWIKGQM